MAAGAHNPWPSLLLVGPTGSGKTPLGEELERRRLGGRRCIHFDFGANLRAAAAAPLGEGGLTADEIAAVQDSLKSGALFEDKDMPMIAKIVERFARARGLTGESILVLNGLPRHRGQAEGLTGVISVKTVVSLEADPGVIVERMRHDPGGDRAGRIDGALEAVEGRLTDFRERTLPLLEYYRERGVPIIVIPVTAAMTAAEMFDALGREMRRR